MNKKISFFLNIFIVSMILALNIYGVFLFQNIYLTIAIFVISIILYISISKIFVSEMYETNENLKKTMQTSIHEINTPVSTILMNTHMLKENCNDETSLKQLNRIEASSHNLLRLYKNMEYYLQKEINQIELVRFDVKEVILNSIDKFEDIKNSIVIQTALKPYFVTKDKIGFEVMIDNIISNAIKHNQKVDLIKVVLENNTLSIIDNGEGIQTKNIYNVFNQYFQENNKDGYGLGLSIVKEYCDKSDMFVNIDSSIKGTTVNLKFKDEV